MAPIKKRTTVRARIAKKTSDQRGKYAPPSPTHEDTTEDPITTTTNTNAETDDSAFGFKLSKQDKRTIKHNQLLHKVREAGISKDKKVRTRRRRPGRKLEAAEDFGGLGEALKEVEGEWEGVSDDEKEGGKEGGNGSGKMKMKMKTLKTRPGAMKRKARMEGAEVQRFGRNLALMMGSEGQGKAEGGETGGDGQKDRWTALRAFIGSTMERDKAFG